MSLLNAQGAWDPLAARRLFPAFSQEPMSSLAYLDSAATGQRLACALAAERDFYLDANANARRGAHLLAARATEIHERGRASVAAFCSVAPEQVIFAQSATMAINTLALALPSKARLGPARSVICSELEHHSNFLPWMELARRTGSAFEALQASAQGELDQQRSVERLSRPDVALFAISAQSNVTGEAPPTRALIAAARAAGAIAVVDAAQAVAHGEWPSDLWGADFAVFSGHKIYATFGAGVLVAREGALDGLSPALFGGGMVSDVSIGADGQWRARWSSSVERFEPGTQNTAAVAALGAALEEVGEWDRGQLRAHEAALSSWSARELSGIPGVRVFGGSAGIVAFHASWAHAHDIGTELDARGVAIRVGHHCAMPLIKRLGVSACSRASFGPYSSQQDAIRLIEGVQAARRRFER